MSCFLRPPFQPTTPTGQGLPGGFVMLSGPVRTHGCFQSALLAVGAPIPAQSPPQHLSRPSSGAGPRQALTNHHTKTHTHPRDAPSPQRCTKPYTQRHTSRLQAQNQTTHGRMYTAGFMSSQAPGPQRTPQCQSHEHTSRSTATNTRTGPVPSPRGQQGADISWHRVRGLSPHVRPGQVPSPRS